MNGRITLTRSSNWEALTNAALKELQPAGQIEYSWIYLTKNYPRADYLKRRFADSTNGAHFIPPIYSWNHFIEKIYDHLPVTLQLLNLTDQLFLIHQILQNTGEHLNYFSVGDRPFSLQITKSIQSIINAYLMNPPVQYPESAGTANDPIRRELHLIVNEYRKCKDGLFLDEPDLLKLFAERIDKKQMNIIFPGLGKIFWEIDAPLYPLQFDIIERLKEWNLELHFFFFYDSHPDFFQNLNGTLNRLRKIAHEEKEIDDPMKLTQSLYRLNSRVLQFDKNLVLAKYVDRTGEAEEVAKRIKKEIIDSGINENRITVTAPDISQYIPLLINAFTKYGVPFTMGRAAKISDLLPIQHLQLWLELLSSNAELSALKKILKSPFFNYHDELKGIPFEEILNSLRVLYDLGVILNQLQKSIDYDETSSSKRKWKSKIEHKKILINVLKNVENDISSLSGSFTADDFFKFFTSQFERHAIVQRILKWKESLPAYSAADILGAIRAFVHGLDAWRNLVGKLNNPMKFTSSQALHLFGLVVNNILYNSYTPFEYGVQVLSIQSVETKDIDKLYLLGCSDGNFPRRDNQPFYGQIEEISRLLLRNRVLDDRRLFLKLLHLPGKEIHISYPEREGEALNVASNLVLELVRTGNQKISAPEPIGIFSKLEILSKAADDSKLKSDLPSSIIKKSDLSHFQRQINITRLRNRLDQPYGIYEGDISSEKTVSEYLAHGVETSEFSVSALENYAKTPTQYFFRRVLRIEEPEAFEEWITPSEKGTMVHRVLHRFHSEFPDADRTLENLCELAKDEIQKLPFLPSILWDMQKEAFLGSENRLGLFPAFFRYEKRQLESTPLKPQYFEVPFGHLGRKIESEFAGGFSQPFEINMDGASLKLRGISDRIDLYDGSGIVIVDYKTGQYASVNEIFEGKSLQLPLYLLAVTHLLRTVDPGFYPFGACYYKIKDDKEKEISKEILFTERIDLENSLKAQTVFPTKNLGEGKKEYSLREFLERSVEFAVKYARGIGAGKFMHHPDKKDCVMGTERSCPFEPLCRVNPKKLTKDNWNAELDSK